MKHKSKIVLVTAIGSLSGDIVIKNLINCGYKVIGCDTHPKSWIADAYNVNKFYQVPSSYEKNYLEVIIDIVQKENVGYIIPLTDPEIDVLNMNRTCFNEHVCLCISGENTIELCRNKLKSYNYLSSQNICSTIITFNKSSINFDEISFPVIGKPIRGRSSEGIMIFGSKELLYEFLITEKADNFVFQPFIDGKIITVDIIRDAEYNKCYTIPRRELIRTKNGAGTSVYVFYDKSFDTVCVKIADALKVDGCVNFEFIEDNKTGERFFMECNPRFSAGVKFSCLAGYDFIINHLNCFIGKQIDELGTYDNMYIARKYEEHITEKQNIRSNNQL